MMKLCIVLSLSLLFHGVLAQEHPDLLKWKAKYPQESQIQLVNDIIIDIISQGDSVFLKKKVREEYFYLSSSVIGRAKDQVYTSHFVKLDGIEAFTKVPVKKKYAIAKVTEFKETFDKNSSSFYDDSKYMTFTFPSVEEGAWTVLNYGQIIADPHFTSVSYFENFIPVEEARLTINVPSGVSINYTFFNNENGIIKQEKKSNSDGSVSYIFTAKSVPARKFEENAPSFAYFTPHVAYRIEYFTNSKGNKVKILDSVESLHAWYRTFLDTMGEEDMVLMKNTLNDIISEADDEITKARKIFHWVQKNIKYIAFEDGMRGFVPHTGAYVCEKKYGDCKDMASILVSLFRAAGLNAYYTWVGTRDIPYTYEELPTPSVDNHMIATYVHGNKVYYLDATSQYSSFDYPSSMIQGKQVLITKGETDFMIAEIPVIDPAMSKATDKVALKLENGVVKGKGTITYTGFKRVFKTYGLNRTSDQEVQEYLDATLEKGNNKFTLSDFSIRNMEDFESPLEIGYSFQLPDHYSQIGDEIYINLNLERNFVSSLIPESRTLATKNEYKYTNEYVYELEIPEGFTVDSKPDDFEITNDLFGLSIDYQISENKIIRKERYFLNYLLLQPEDFTKWNDSVKKANEAHNSLVILKRTID